MKKTYMSVAVAAALALSACGGDNNNVRVTPTPAAPAVTNAVALTASNELWLIDIANPDKVVKRMAVTGITAGENLLGIDYRPSNGMLYGITESAVYVIDDVTGVATLNKTLATELPGDNFGVDFNPKVDKLRVVNNLKDSFVVDVDSGTVKQQADIGSTAIDGMPSSGQPMSFTITAAAYTNSISKPVTTRLWDIDTQGDRLFQQEAADNNSELSGEITLGVDATDVNGFDIDGFNNKGYAALTVGGMTSLYEINLAATSNAANKETAKPLGNGMVPIKGITLKTKTTAAYALTDDGKILRFLPTAPQSASTDDAKQITGLMPGSDTTAAETVLGIDFRPADGKLYGITSKSRIITINKATGVATVGGSLSLNLPPTTDGKSDGPKEVYSVDFNPMANKLRVMNSSGLNLRIDVDQFSTTIDGMLSKVYGNPPTSVLPIKIIAAAYTNSFTPKPADTMLYDLDAENKSLALQKANAGTFTYQGPVTPSFDRASFDIIGGSDGLPLVGLATGAGVMSLYSIDFGTGMTTAYPNATNTIGTGTPIVVNDIALTLE